MKLDLQSFKLSISEPAPPDGLSLALQALWWDAKGDWQKAHECAQERDDRPGMHVHAYLHRKEGDFDNADYWYGRAGDSRPRTDLAVEWRELALRLLARDPA